MLSFLAFNTGTSSQGHDLQNPSEWVSGCFPDCSDRQLFPHLLSFRACFVKEVIWRVLPADDSFLTTSDPSQGGDLPCSETFSVLNPGKAITYQEYLLVPLGAT